MRHTALSLQAYHHFFLQGLRLVSSSCGLVLFSNHSHRSLLKVVCLERLPDKVPVDPAVSQPCAFLSKRWGQTILSGWCSHISSSSYASEGANLSTMFSYCFFCNWAEDLAVHFMNSNPRVLLNSLLLRSCCLRPLFLIPFLCSCFG
jgi:hypothetical protein